MASALHILYPSESYKLDKIRSPLPSVPVGAGGGLLSGLFADRMAATGPFGPMALPVPLACLQPKLGGHPDNPGLDIWLQLTRGAGGPPSSSIVASAAAAAAAAAAAEDVRFRPSPPRGGDYPQTELPDSPCDLRVSPRPLQNILLAKPASYNSKSPPSSGPGAPTGNGGGPTVKRRGRGKERIWTQIECFNNDAQAKAFVQAERTWVMQKKTQVQEGTKVYYECSKYRSAKCPAAVSILYHANSDRVSVFRASGDHNHAPLEPRHNNKNSNNTTSHPNGTVSTTTTTTTTASHQSHNNNSNGSSSSTNTQGRQERPDGSSSVIKNGQEIARMALQRNGGAYSPPASMAGTLSYKAEAVTPTLHRPVATYPMKRPEPIELRHKFKQHVIALSNDALMGHSHPHIRAPEPSRVAHFDYATYHHLQQQQQQQQQYQSLPHIAVPHNGQHHHHHHTGHSTSSITQLDSHSPPLMGFRPLAREVKLSRSRSRTRSRSRSRDDEDDGGTTPQSDARLTDSSHESGSESSASCGGGSSSTVATTATTITRHSVISRTPSAPLALSLLLLPPEVSSRCFVTNCRSNHLAAAAAAVAGTTSVTVSATADHQQLPPTANGASPSSSGVSCSSSESSSLVATRIGDSKNSQVAMLRFPKDLLKRMVWSMNVNKTNADGSLCIAASGDLICAAHFSRDRFEIFPGVLKPDAVPTLFGPDLVLTRSEGTHDAEQTDCKVTTSKEVPVRRSRTARNKRALSASLLRRLQRAQHTVDKLRLSNRAHQARINILRRIVSKMSARKEQIR